mmetsp:Transcript_35122/g.33370  ORF Transcript_35122/g.33370 Transcript_35122/m.33370 type:complete len:396 (+) Transcript_35122:112-1299(+)
MWKLKTPLKSLIKITNVINKNRYLSSFNNDGVSVIKDTDDNDDTSKETKYKFNKDSSGYKHPEWMVDTVCEVEGNNTIPVPLFTDIERQEIYKKYKSDPEKWTLQKISNYFSCSMERARAVVYLMGQREALMKKNGVYEISPVWAKVFDQHNIDREINTVEVLCAEYELSQDEVKHIIKQMGDHYGRLETVAEVEEQKRELLDRLKDGGLDVRFRETPVETTRTRFNRSYFPALFGDDGYEYAKHALLTRIQSETKAVLTCDLDYFVKREERTQLKNAELDARYSAPPLIPPAVSRWKFAFKDLSKGKANRLAKAEPIIIRTRHGKLRVANALEDCQRSWTKHPTGMDMIFNEDKLVKFRDPDGDEEAANKRPEQKRMKFKRIKEELALLKAQKA